MMVDLQARLATLESKHRAALWWFINNSGKEKPWPRPLPDGTHLATKAKGIFKPKGTEYALSVRQTLGGRYPDRGPVSREDGTWIYAYFQEGDDPALRDAKYTNRGLMACWRDQVPVGVMRQVSPRPNVRYRVLGVALVAGWDAGYFFLEGFSAQALARDPGPEAEVAVLSAVEADRLVEEGAFNPTGVIDGRQRAMASIVRRQGQPAFRKALLNIYEHQCAISGCHVVSLLEAAHIVPYRGEATNDPRNGLLLRTDLHSLFDLGLLAIDPDTFTVILSSALDGSEYAVFEGRRLRAPRYPEHAPSREALRQHLQWAFGDRSVPK